MKRKDSRPVNRRDFLISSAALAGAGLPTLAWGASKPCPPPSFSATGGSSSSSSCVSSAGQLPVLILRGASSSSAWTVGHAFRKGDVPAGEYLVGQGVSQFQADVRNWWTNADGSPHSVKFAVLSGIGGPEVQLAVAGAAPQAAALTQGQLAAALPATTIKVGGHTTSLNSLVGTGARQRTVCEGPVMSNWIYRQAVSGSSHLVVWADVRFYANGAIEIFPWVENCYLGVSGATNVVATCTVTIGGTQRFSQSIDIKHHTRVPLLSGSAFSYWVGADPGITPQHDTSYLMDTKLLPNYGWRSPTETRLNGLVQTYTPNTLAGWGSAMGAAGGEGSINGPSTVFYLTSGGDARAYRAAITFGLSSGSWSIHYRDETTQEPFKYSSYPNLSLASGLPAASGTTNGTAAVSHLPGFAYVPYLLTGRWFFADEVFFWNNYCYLDNQSGERFGADGIQNTTQAGSHRRAAWALNSLAHSIVIAPEGHPLRADLIASWEANCEYYRVKFVDGGTYKTRSFGTAWVSPQGYLGSYDGSGANQSPYGTPNGVNAWFDAGFMTNYVLCVFGTAWDYELPISTAARAKHQAVRDKLYQQVIQRAGDGSAYNWRRFIVYAFPIGADSQGLPLDTWYTAAQSYAAYCSAYSLSPSLPATEGLTLKLHSSENDLVYGTSSLPYGSSAVMALALAKEHGVPGAADGWRRISTASNFASSFGPYFNGETPSFGVLPR